MRLLTALVLCLSTLPLMARAACTGTNQIDGLPGPDRAALIAAADAAPYARGNIWQATRGDRAITLVGTFHLDDPRHDALMERLVPLIDQAAVVLVEAGPDEEAALLADMAARPDLMFTTDGPTLPESLPPETWAQLKDALRGLGIPPFLGAKMQPAYLAMILSIPPCAAEDMAKGARGLDQRIIARATSQGIPVRALEPHDTLFRIFAGQSEADQRSMLDVALALSGQAGDSFVTLADAYFAEQSRLIWELSRLQAAQASTAPPETIAAEFATMEDALILARNRAWIPVIEAASAEGPVLAAFGALHLSGDGGVLDLLARDSYTVERVVP